MEYAHGPWTMSTAAGLRVHDIVDQSRPFNPSSRATILCNSRGMARSNIDH
jgi:hypothetical protein